MKISRRAIFYYSSAALGMMALNVRPTSTFAQERAVIKPKRLVPGMTVGLVSPASNALENEDIVASMDFVRSLGYEVKASPNLFARNQYLAGTDEQRAGDLNSFFIDPDVDALFCTRGG